MLEYESDDEERILRSRISVLKHVALEMSDEIRSQNIKLKNLEPGFNDTLNSIFRNIKNIRKLKPNHFKTWLYYIGATVIFGFLFFILFVLT